MVEEGGAEGLQNVFFRKLPKEDARAPRPHHKFVCTQISPFSTTIFKIFFLLKKYHMIFQKNIFFFFLSAETSKKPHDFFLFNKDSKILKMISGFLSNFKFPKSKVT